MILRLLSAILLLLGALGVGVFGAIFWMTGAMGQMRSEFWIGNFVLGSALLGAVAGIIAFWRPGLAAGVGLAAMLVLLSTMVWGSGAIHQLARERSAFNLEQHRDLLFAMAIPGAAELAGVVLAWLGRVK